MNIYDSSIAAAKTTVVYAVSGVGMIIAFIVLGVAFIFSIFSMALTDLVKLFSEEDHDKK